MKKIMLAFVALFLSVSAFAQIKSASLTASGLTCSMCSKAIYKALSKVAFVQNVQADIEGSKYQIKFKPGANVVLDDLKRAVENAGFSVASLQVTAEFPPTQIKNDAHIEYGGALYHFVGVPDENISGQQTFRVVDKNFLPEKEYARYAGMTSMKCIQTGHMEACCQKGKAGERVYHVTL
ncbi:MAG: heavy-metal-associated domain-containing protein [Bacteroidetes bacterium]|nr:heavy-metal-associated domain-containing protein [Bacteroidota bacterium]MBS1628434.1 heavy-metal-associated domain-containing protein [Bacteroidota bacterium]